MNKGFTIAAAAALMTLAAGAARAAGPALPSTAPVDSTSLVEQAHQGDRHRACMQNRRLGWHYHRGRGRVVQCRPARPSGAFWIWRSDSGRVGWWHRNERRWR